MAGSNSTFDAATFRSNIKAAMRMGLPSNTQERATFEWRSTATYETQDATSRPYDWTAAAVTTHAPASVQVDCAVEMARVGDGVENAVGSFDEPRMILTLLDEDYALVVGASHVLLGGNTFVIRFVAPPIGLFDVTVYQMYLQAVDES